MYSSNLYSHTLDFVVRGSVPAFIFLRKVNRHMMSSYCQYVCVCGCGCVCVCMCMRVDVSVCVCVYKSYHFVREQSVSATLTV